MDSVTVSASYWLKEDWIREIYVGGKKLSLSLYIFF